MPSKGANCTPVVSAVGSPQGAAWDGGREGVLAIVAGRGLSPGPASGGAAHGARCTRSLPCAAVQDKAAGQRQALRPGAWARRGAHGGGREGRMARPRAGSFVCGVRACARARVRGLRALRPGGRDELGLRVLALFRKEAAAGVLLGREDEVRPLAPREGLHAAGTSIRTSTSTSTVLVLVLVLEAHLGAVG